MRRLYLAFSVFGLAAALVLTGVAGMITLERTAQPDRGTGVVRATFYYPWYPEVWHPGDVYRPSLGRYESARPEVLSQHFAGMRHARLDAAISSWWGVGTPTDRRLPLVLQAAADEGLAVAPYYEPECCDDDPDAAELATDLARLEELSHRPGWLFYAGRPVVFVYNSGATGCADVARWREATAGWTRFYVQMKVFPGFRQCADQPDSWHEYAPASPRAVYLPDSFNVSPGYWHHEEDQPRLVRDVDRFRDDLADQVASRATWQLVTSFSEWGEGTAVESSVQWPSASGYGQYLDAMREAYRPTGGDLAIEPAAGRVAGRAAGRDEAPSAAAGRVRVVWAAGDLCDDDNDKPDCRRVGRLMRNDKATDAFVALGDLQYEYGTLSEFKAFYDKKLGRGMKLKRRTHPVPGNHEFDGGRAPGYFAYWGKRAGNPSKGYYSRKLGAWRLLVTNSNCSEFGCGATEAQGRWLRRKLNRSGRCTVVAAHHPAISDGSYYPGTDAGRELWATAVTHGADLFLSGHDHNYQRFGPRDGSLTPRARGLRQFVVGSGGKNLTGLRSVNRSVYRQDDVFGALRLKLRPGGYKFRFVNIRGVTMDKGRGRCR